MFRASFPTAGDEAEKIDSNWVKANYDLAGANGGGKLRLAGTWVPPALAVHLAPSYSLGQVVFPLAEAQPDASASYRKSSRHTTNGPVTANANALSSPLKTNRVPPTIPESPSTVPPTKRTRRESASPAQARIITPSSPLKQAVLPTTVEVQETQEAPEGEAEPEVPGPDMEEDLAESKALIERLKREKAEAEAKNQELAKELNSAGVDEAVQASAGAKRGREVTPPLTMNLDRQPENIERQLVRNRSAQQANRRSAMWGAVAFAVGLGVT